jgi:hypothetical protein
VEAQASTPQGWTFMARAGLFGLGAAVAGAAIYYAVIALANLEVGFVAILIGYMVGYAVRKGAGAQGGRRFQILAVALTYWAVGLAYTPLALMGPDANEQKSATTASANSSGAPAVSPAAPLPAEENSTPSRGGFLVGLAILFGFIFALPVMVIVGSMPSGVISAFIILIGMRQAWQMTAAATLNVDGPFRIGTGPPAAAASA